jgi:hypothetical protein
MLVRDITGRLHIVSRKDCKNDADYYYKLVKIRSEFTQYYKSIIKIGKGTKISAGLQPTLKLTKSL